MLKRREILNGGYVSLITDNLRGGKEVTDDDVKALESVQKMVANEKVKAAKKTKRKFLGLLSRWIVDVSFFQEIETNEILPEGRKMDNFFSADRKKVTFQLRGD